MTPSQLSPAAKSIAVHTTLEGFHPRPGSSLQESKRWNDLTREFRKRFGRDPTHVARAPGRVNLIGEHIDYCLFGCLPTAVERDILIACAPTEEGKGNAVNVQNMDSKYASASFEAVRQGDKGEWSLPIDTTKLRWESYIKAGYHGVLAHFFGDANGPSPRGADFLASGTVPLGGGLSSSAALVVASTLAFLAVEDKLDAITQGQLVELCMENEKRVGVNSGGLDQGASVFSSPGTALYITFYPKLHASPVPLPQSAPPAVFVVANTLKTANKLETSKIHYNLRVVETLVAARVLAKGLGVNVGPKEKVRLREVLSRWTGEGDSEPEDEDQEIARLKDALNKVLPEVERILGTEQGKRGLTKAEMIEVSGLSDIEFEDVYLSWVDVEATHFQLYKRAKHVFSEALRVLRFREVSILGVLDAAKAVPHPTTRQALARQVPEADPNSTASLSEQRELGRLMNESHQSCDELFDCSSPELNELTALARQAGALGSRLTGAGWGGCCVSLVPETDVATFIEKIKQAYVPYQSLSQDELNAVFFATKSGSGAGVYVVGETTEAV
ncbi:galactokinase [Tulasnella sp. JGI-2019a]|nr:galactokinase [Tulasnella sp. JGI-2019a]KAG9013067.1 galactokinase [Tulasnella sp. JGI-2019a]